MQILAQIGLNWQFMCSLFLSFLVALFTHLDSLVVSCSALETSADNTLAFSSIQIKYIFCVKCQGVHSILQQQRLFQKKHDPLTQDNPQIFLWASFFFKWQNYFWTAQRQRKCASTHGQEACDKALIKQCSFFFFSLVMQLASRAVQFFFSS